MNPLKASQRKSSIRRNPSTSLNSIFAPNSTYAFCFPWTIGRTHGWLRLTMRSSIRFVACAVSGNTWTEIFRSLHNMPSRAFRFPNTTGFSPAIRQRLRAPWSPRSVQSFPHSCCHPDSCAVHSHLLSRVNETVWHIFRLHYT